MFVTQSEQRGFGNIDFRTEAHLLESMELLVAIIKDYRKVEDILLGFVELDVTGATVVEGKGMGQILGEVPIMADLRGLFPGSGLDSYIIISAVPKSKIEACVKLIENICSPMEQASAGVMFTLPIGLTRGMKDRLEE